MGGFGAGAGPDDADGVVKVDAGRHMIMLRGLVFRVMTSTRHLRRDEPRLLSLGREYKVRRPG